jgi:hypothetical protein
MRCDSNDRVAVLTRKHNIVAFKLAIKLLHVRLLADRWLGKLALVGSFSGERLRLRLLAEGLPAGGLRHQRLACEFLM